LCISIEDVKIKFVFTFSMFQYQKYQKCLYWLAQFGRYGVRVWENIWLKMVGEGRWTKWRDSLFFSCVMRRFKKYVFGKISTVESDSAKQIYFRNSVPYCTVRLNQWSITCGTLRILVSCFWHSCSQQDGGDVQYTKLLPALSNSSHSASCTFAKI